MRSRLGNPQDLTGIDLVRIGQHWLVGFKDHWVFHWITVNCFRNFGEAVSTLNRMENGFWFRCFNLNIVLNRGNSLNVSCGEDQFFSVGLRACFSGKGNFVSIDCYLEISDV